MAERESERWRVVPGAKVDLERIDSGATDGAPGGKAATKFTFADLRGLLREVQERLWAERRQSLLVVLQSMDAGGKDGTLKHLFRGFNPVGARVASFRAPTDVELAHDFLWRVHDQTPGKGEVVVFNRSHYEDVLVVRVHEIVPEEVWRPRYRLINHFEENLHAAATKVVKLFLHISIEEQASRLRARLEDPVKRWKFNPRDLEERKLWGVYLSAYAEAMERTSTDEAPWFVVPADRKWYRNWAVSHILLEVLDDMNPRYPPRDDLDGIVVA